MWLVLAAQSRKLDTFTLSVESKQNRPQFNEASLARKTARAIGTYHHEIELDEKNALYEIENLFQKILDEPIVDLSEPFEQLSVQRNIVIFQSLFVWRWSR